MEHSPGRQYGSGGMPVAPGPHLPARAHRQRRTAQPGTGQPDDSLAGTGVLHHGPYRGYAAGPGRRHFGTPRRAFHRSHPEQREAGGHSPFRRQRSAAGDRPRDRGGTGHRTAGHERGLPGQPHLYAGRARCARLGNRFHGGRARAGDRYPPRFPSRVNARVLRWLCPGGRRAEGPDRSSHQPFRKPGGERTCGGIRRPRDRGDAGGGPRHTMQHGG